MKNYLKRFTDVHWEFSNHFELVYHVINQQIDNRRYENCLHRYYER